MGESSKSKGFTEEETYWILGVINVFFSSWLAGAFPATYWIYYIGKILYLLIARLYKFQLKKMQFFLLDYCYTINYLLVIYLILAVCFSGGNSFKETSYYAFRLLFSATTGPLAISVLAFRNSLVFHSLDQITILAIHWSPAVSMWGMRWWVNDLEKTFSSTFYVGCGEPYAENQAELFFSNDVCKGSFVELWVYPVIAYVVLYSIPYGLFFFYFGKEYIEKNGYKTNYAHMQDNPSVKYILNIGGPDYKELKYSLMHGTAVCMALFAGVLFWHSFALHTIYLGLILLTAITNGSSYYFRVYLKQMYKKWLSEESEEIEEEAQESTEETQKMVGVPGDEL